MKLLTPLETAKAPFRNRVVMAPMVVFGQPAPNGVMGDALIEHYLSRAGTGMGMLISQALTVSARTNSHIQAGVYSFGHADYLSRIAEACHKNDTRFVTQLVFPSKGFNRGDTINMLTVDEIQMVRDEFIQAARIAHKAGCDGIELHGAHTFFLNMFASPVSNKRGDKYGGGLEGRLRLAKEIVDGIRANTGDAFLISYRFGLGGKHEEDKKTALALAALGVDLLHASSGIEENQGDNSKPQGFPGSWVTYAGTGLKEGLPIPLIVVNDIRSFERGEALLEQGLTDLVAYGKPFLADGEFMTKSLAAPTYQPCLRCKVCLWFSDGAKCPAVLRRNRKKAPETGTA